MNKVKNWIIVILAIIVAMFMIYVSFDNLYNPDSTPHIAEGFVSWMDSFENPELIVGEKYVIKDVRDVETIWGVSLNDEHLGYHTFLILESNENERIVYKYKSFNEDNVTMWNEYDDSIEGRTYTITPFVPGDIVTYLGNNQFELCSE